MIKQTLLLFTACLMAFASYAQAPIITSFSPASGPVGTLVTITGTNLISPTAFTIGGVPAIVVSDADTILVGMVMPGAATGTVSVTTAGGTDTGSGTFTIMPTPFPGTQQGNKLVSTRAIGLAQQGNSVAISADGNTAIVGGPEDNSAGFGAMYIGAAWIYYRSGTTWTQGPKLIGAGAVGYPQEGTSVAISADGNTAIVGGRYDNSDTGAVWVFTRSGNTWTQQGGKLVGTGAITSSNGIWQGFSVSLSADGNTAIVGGGNDNGYTGAAWVYTRSGTVWTQQGNKLVGTGASGPAYQGISVSLSADGNTAIVGGEGDDSLAGAAWVYTRSGAVWTQQGNKLVGAGAFNGANGAWQGNSVCLSADGSTAIVGGPNDNSDVGAVWVYSSSTTGIEDVPSAQEHIHLYPNPNTGAFTLTTDN
jgi:hypothetical protein